MARPAMRAGFGDEAFEAVGVGLFGVEAVAAVVLEEEGREAEVVADVAGGFDGFVGQDGHEDFRMGGRGWLRGIRGRRGRGRCSRACGCGSSRGRM